MHRLGIRPHRERGAQIPDKRRDDVALPASVGSAIFLAAAQPDGRRVDRLLPERPESLPLERCAVVPDLAPREERLQAVVGGAGEQHSAEDLDAFRGRERRLDRLAAEEPVARLQELRLGLLDPRVDRDPRRRLVETLRRQVIDRVQQRFGERAAESLDGVLVAAGVRRRDRAERLQVRTEREREALRDERAEPRGEREPRPGGGARFDDAFHEGGC